MLEYRIKSLPEDVLSLTTADMSEMAPNIAEALNVKMRQVGGIEAKEALSHVMLQLLHWRTLNGTPTSTKYINQMYGRIASRLKVRVSDLLIDLIVRDLIMEFPHGERPAYVATKAWNSYYSEVGGLVDPEPWLHKLK